MGQLWALKESASWNKARFEFQPPHSVHAASETFLEILEDFMSNQIGWCSVARTMKDTGGNFFLLPNSYIYIYSRFSFLYCHIVIFYYSFVLYF